jgi:uncharacterized protein YhjY with autotransporter beta-barrel domain
MPNRKLQPLSFWLLLGLPLLTPAQALDFSVSSDYRHNQLSLYENDQVFVLNSHGSGQRLGINLNDHWSAGIRYTEESASDNQRISGETWRIEQQYQDYGLDVVYQWQNDWLSLSLTRSQTDLYLLQANSAGDIWQVQQDSQSHSIDLLYGHDWYMGNWQTGITTGLGYNKSSRQRFLLTRDRLLTSSSSQEDQNGSSISGGVSLGYLASVYHLLLLPSAGLDYQHSLTGELLTTTRYGGRRQESGSSQVSAAPDNAYASGNLSLTLLGETWHISTTYLYPFSQPHDHQITLGAGLVF